MPSQFKINPTLEWINEFVKSKVTEVALEYIRSNLYIKYMFVMNWILCPKTRDSVVGNSNQRIECHSSDAKNWSRNRSSSSKWLRWLDLGPRFDLQSSSWTWTRFSPWDGRTDMSNDDPDTVVYFFTWSSILNGGKFRQEHSWHWSKSVVISPWMWRLVGQPSIRRC